MKEIQIHPIDLDYNQIGQHRREYAEPKGGRAKANAYTVPKATLEKVFISLSKKIKLNQDSWKHILRQLDQTNFALELNKSSESPWKQLETHLDGSHARTFNFAEKMDLELLISKIEFTDFLRAI